MQSFHTPLCCVFICLQHGCYSWCEHFDWTNRVLRLCGVDQPGHCLLSGERALLHLTLITTSQSTFSGTLGGSHGPWFVLMYENIRMHLSRKKCTGCACVSEMHAEVCQVLCVRFAVVLFLWICVLRIAFMSLSMQMCDMCNPPAPHPSTQIQSFLRSLQASDGSGQRRTHFIIAIALLQPLLVVWLTWQLVMYSPPSTSTASASRPVGPT